MTMPNLFWFTGQAGAGKTTLANLLCAELQKIRPLHKYVIIDGDDIRALYNNQDYSLDGRRKNVDFVHKLCVFLMNNNITPIVCMVSPFALQRSFFCREYNGIEIFVSCSEIRGRESYHIDYYELPHVDNDVSFQIDTTSNSDNDSFEQMMEMLHFYGKI